MAPRSRRGYGVRLHVALGRRAIQYWHAPEARDGVCNHGRESPAIGADSDRGVSLQTEDQASGDFGLDVERPQPGAGTVLILADIQQGSLRPGVRDNQGSRCFASGAPARRPWLRCATDSPPPGY